MAAACRSCSRRTHEPVCEIVRARRIRDHAYGQAAVRERAVAACAGLAVIRVARPAAARRAVVIGTAAVCEVVRARRVRALADGAASGRSERAATVVGGPLDGVCRRTVARVDGAVRIRAIVRTDNVVRARRAAHLTDGQHLRIRPRLGEEAVAASVGDAVIRPARAAAARRAVMVR